MKLATFQSQRGPAVGAVDSEGGRILDLYVASASGTGEPHGMFTSMLSLIDAGEAGLSAARELAARWPDRASIPLSGASLLSPLPEPRQMRDGMFFELHVLNAGNRVAEKLGLPPRPVPDVWYKQPLYYKANRFGVVGHEHTVVWPRYSKSMDFECELACVIGKTARDITPDTAMDHIFGFTIFNDFSARDAQFLEMQGPLGPAKGKDFDGGNVLGPWIVTSDEIGDPHNLKMDARVNGERWGGGTSADMHHNWPAVLAHISNCETLRAGEVIGSGTVGTGCGLELGRELKHGDVVELEIEKIGVLRNRVVVA
jgi:2-keto-4-pentenoate hydratase/2-oxohepta-3-ene-1,7-dioic acid hydratase in catechol pathway